MLQNTGNTTFSVPHPLPSPSSITRDQLLHFASLYEDVASQLKRRAGKRASPKPPEPLAALDAFRWVDLPCSLARRRGEAAANGDFSLKKRELERLMNWKLYRGTFRPTLLGLIKANTEDAVKESTAQALATLQGMVPSMTSNVSEAPSPPAPMTALDQLCALRGVGPATASLILSCASPEHVPFLGDDLYMWVFGERPTKYDKKEWKALWEEIWVLRLRLIDDGDASKMLNARDVERAGTVLGWAKQDRLEPLPDVSVANIAIENESKQHENGQSKEKGPVDGPRLGRKRTNILPDDDPAKKRTRTRS